MLLCPTLETKIIISLQNLFCSKSLWYMCEFYPVTCKLCSDHKKISKFARLSLAAEYYNFGVLLLQLNGYQHPHPGAVFWNQSGNVQQVCASVSKWTLKYKDIDSSLTKTYSSTWFYWISSKCDLELQKKQRCRERT